MRSLATTLLGGHWAALPNLPKSLKWGRKGDHAKASSGEDSMAADRSLWMPSLGTLERHPKDGWRFADPVALPKTTQVAFRALIKAICPPPPAPGNAAMFAKIEEDVLRALRYMHPLFAASLLIAVHALDLSPLWNLKGLRRLRALDRDEAEDFLNEVAKGALGRQLVFAARMAILSQYFDSDEVQKAIGYEPTEFMQSRLNLRTRMMAGSEPAPKEHIGPYSEEAAS